MIRKSVLKNRIAFLLITMGCIYSSGYCFSLVGGAPMRLLAIVITFLGIALLPRVNSRPFLIRASVANFVCIITVIAVFLSYFVNATGNTLFDHMILVLRFVAAALIAERISMETFSKCYVDTMIVFACVAIAVWVFQISGISLPGYQFQGLNGVAYKTILLCTWPIDSTDVMGPFWEEGLFATFLVVTVLIEGCFRKEKARISTLIICSLAVYLTQSTAGYILLGLAFFIIIRKQGRKYSFVDVLILLMFIVMFVNYDNIISWLIEINPDVFWKLKGDNYTYNTRLMSPVACFQIFMKAPLFGNGLTKATELYNGYKFIFHMDALTSTSVFMLSAFGVLGIFYTVGWIVAIVKQKNLPMLIRIAMVSLFLMILNKEPHYNNMLMSLVMFVLLNHTENKSDEDSITNEIGIC